MSFVKDMGIEKTIDRQEIILKSFILADKSIRQSFGRLSIGLSVAQRLSVSFERKLVFRY